MGKKLNDQISVCIIRHSYYPNELNVKREAETLRDEGFDVHVICLRGPDEHCKENVEAVNVYRLPVGHKRGKILRYISEYAAFFSFATIKLLALHVKYRFRIVQVNTMPDVLVFVSLIPKLSGAKIVLHMHEPMPELFATIFNKWYTKYFLFLIRMMERFSLAFADEVLTVTKEMRNQFASRGADINKITVILNVPEDKLFQAEKYEKIKYKIQSVNKNDRSKKKFCLLTHGTIEQRCGFDIVIKALKRLKKDMPDIEYRFMGNGEYTKDVLLLAKKLSVENNVTYLGYVSFEDMIKEIIAADITVVPIKRNSYSVLVHTNKMYEYIALDKPVVISKLDSVAAYFSDNSLLYFEPDDDVDLAKKLKYAYDFPEEMKHRVEISKKIYHNYLWKHEKKKYLQAYWRLLKKRKDFSNITEKPYDEKRN
jgi:glycosyltransferase involved in cell wall biosynthesis